MAKRPKSQASKQGRASEPGLHEPASGPARLWSRGRSFFIVCLRSPLTALLFFCCVATTSVRHASATFDEPIILASGAHFLSTGDPSVNAENPPLLKALYAVPIALYGKLDAYRNAPDSVHSTYDAAFGFDYANGCFFSSGNHRDILFACRFVAILLAALFGYALFLTAVRVFDRGVAILILWLFCLCPNILANATLATLDLGCAYFMFLATVLFHRSLTDKRFTFAPLCGLASGAALLTKYTAILLFASMALQFSLALIRTRTTFLPRGICLVRATLIAAIALCMVGAGYGFNGIGHALSDGSFRSTLMGASAKIGIVNELARLFPSGYLRGFDITAYLNDAGLFNICMGKLLEKGGRCWYYYPALAAVKIPLPMLAAAGAGLWLAVTRKIAVRWEGFAFFAILPALTLFNFSFIASRQLGLRYILAAWPFFLLLPGYLALALRNGPRVHRRIWTGLLLWYALGTISVYPHFLTYFNLLGGGPKNGWKFFADSNHDWGQDLPLLSDWQRLHGNPPMLVFCFGSAPLEAYGVYSMDVNNASLRYIAISTTNTYFYRRIPSIQRLLTSRKPAAQLGNTILIYEL